MDVRYNVIQWVHRSTRGWSYGSSVRDPRTQEILKGHVTLGSLRVRQDYLIAEGLIAPYGEDDSIDEAKEKLSEFALARIRQLSHMKWGIPRYCSQFRSQRRWPRVGDGLPASACHTR